MLFSLLFSGRNYGIVEEGSQDPDEESATVRPPGPGGAGKAGRIAHKTADKTAAKTAENGGKRRKLGIVGQERSEGPLRH